MRKLILKHLRLQRLQRLKIATFLVIGIFSSSVFADINNIKTGNTNATINISLTVPNVCNIIGLDATQNKEIDQSTGSVIISGISSSCNSSSSAPTIGFISSNNYHLKGADTVNNQGGNIPYSVTFGNDPISTTQAALPITSTPKDLKFEITDPSVYATKKPDTYSDVVTATISF